MVLDIRQCYYFTSAFSSFILIINAWEHDPHTEYVPLDKIPNLLEH